jgi:hypothetical protein
MCRVNSNKVNYRHSTVKIKVITLWTNTAKSQINFRQALEENTLIQRSKQTKNKRNNNYKSNNSNFINTNLNCY